MNCNKTKQNKKRHFVQKEIVVRNLHRKKYVLLLFFNIYPKLGEVLKGKKASVSKVCRAYYGIWKLQEQGGNERLFFRAKDSTENETDVARKNVIRQTRSN